MRGRQFAAFTEEQKGKLEKEGKESGPSDLAQATFYNTGDWSEQALLRCRYQASWDEISLTQSTSTANSNALPITFTQSTNEPARLIGGVHLRPISAAQNNFVLHWKWPAGTSGTGHTPLTASQRIDSQSLSGIGQEVVAIRAKVTYHRTLQRTVKIANGSAGIVPKTDTAVGAY